MLCFFLQCCMHGFTMTDRGVGSFILVDTVTFYPPVGN